MREKHERDLNEIGAKFKKIDASYREDAVENKKQVHMMELEREENTRLVDLYRTQNEVLDTQNRLYSDKLDSLEKALVEKESQLKELREQSMATSQENADLKLAALHQ